MFSSPKLFYRQDKFLIFYIAVKFEYWRIFGYKTLLLKISTQAKRDLLNCHEKILTIFEPYLLQTYTEYLFKIFMHKEYSLTCAPTFVLVTNTYVGTPNTFRIALTMTGAFVSQTKILSTIRTFFCTVHIVVTVSIVVTRASHVMVMTLDACIFVVTFRCAFVTCHYIQIKSSNKQIRE